jgi:hypothetical protein
MDLILTWFGVPTGIEERRTPDAERQTLAATIVRGQLILPSAFCFLTSDFGLFDHTGRRVLALTAGANDLSALPAGVYFVREHRSHTSNRSYRILLVR